MEAAQNTVTSIPAAIEQAISPLLNRHGYEVVHIVYEPRSRLLRLYVDHPNGVTVEDCTQVSRLVSDLLDAEGYSDRIPGRYTLEVSSPGLDRPLVKPGHFHRFTGRQVKVTTFAPQEGRRRFNGRLVTADEAGIKVEVDGRVYALRYQEVASARLVPEL